jgi:hypothetical protein
MAALLWGPLAVSYQMSDKLTVGIEHLWPLAVLPVAVLLLAVLVRRGGDDSRSASTRSRRLLFASRLVLMTLLIVAAMGPYTLQTRETPGEPRVTLLTDESDSMAVYPNATGDLVADVEAAGVPVTTATIAAGTNSRVGDGVVANIRENGTVVLLSDGRVTGGRSLAAVGESARELNATVSAVDLRPERGEVGVAVFGPDTVSVGLDAEFAVALSGASDPGPVPVTVTVDGEEVANGTLAPGERLPVTRTFEERGDHRVTARVDADDVYDRNNVAYHTVRVVEQPSVLYVGGKYPLREYLDSLYDVTTAERIPDDIEPYQAVVVQNRPAPGMGNLTALQAHVVDGGGLVVAGGPDAYENGGYEESPLAPMLPVRVGNATGGTANVVLLVDISGSAEDGLGTQKAVALDALSQLGDENRVGVVAFSAEAYRVSALQALSEDREVVTDRIRRLQTGGRPGTHIDVGLKGARDLLGDRDGTVILLSDGLDDSARAGATAGQLGSQGIRVITVGTGERVNEETLRGVAQASGGTYFAADETSRLELLFGGGATDFESENLTVVERTFVTSGVDLTARPGQSNRVAIKSGADYQVATGEGTPAITSWRFGLGRVVSVTSYDESGGLDGLLDEPDSLVTTRSVNYAVGDPRADATGITDVGAARVGRPTPVTYRGASRPDAEVAFRQVGEETYRGEVTPADAGYHELLDTEYAVNYPAEYREFGTDPSVSSLVATTGGTVFRPDEADTIARLAREQATQVRSVRDRWDPVIVLVAVLLFATEVLARRVQVYRGRTSLESGLP